jgi:PST family polysaccharide transporter
MDEASLWRPMVRAMSQTGGASIASGLLSALGTKIVATLLGPGSVALIATLQQLRDGAVIAATANGRTALVQGASELETVARREYLRTVAFLFAGATFLVALTMLAAPREILGWTGLPRSGEPLLAWVAVTVVLLSLFVYLSAILNALKQIGKLAWLQLAAPVAAALAAWPLAREARAGHPIALVFFLVIPAAATAVAASIALGGHRDQLRAWFQGPGRWWTAQAARHFLSISGAMLMSGLAATAVLLAVRASITRHESLTVTGQFDAAWNISMNQVTLILGSVQTYYLPSLASMRGPARAAQMRHMMLVATLAVVPVIVALEALKPLVVSVLYSHAFALSPGFLRWTLLGDFLKVSSWVLATPLLASRDLGAFLAFDLIAHAIFFGAAMLLARILDPAEGAAMGFFVSYAAYFALCYARVRTRYGFHFGAAGFSAWLGGAALVAGASFHCWSDSTVHFARALVWISLAIGFSAGFGMYMRRRAA